MCKQIIISIFKFYHVLELHIMSGLLRSSETTLRKYFGVLFVTILNYHTEIKIVLHLQWTMEVYIKTENI